MTTDTAVERISVLSTQYLTVDVEAPADPTGAAVHIAVVAPETDPEAGDWLVAEWDPDVTSSPYRARLLVEPGDFDPGVYRRWVRATALPEVPVLPGSLVRFADAVSLTPVDLAWIRDEIGDGAPPHDQELDDLLTSLGHRTLVALRVLKRRRAALSAGGVSQFSLAGVFSVGLKGDSAALDRQIARLEAAYAAETGLEPDGDAVGVPRVYRPEVGFAGRSR